MLKILLLLLILIELSCSKLSLFPVDERYKENFSGVYTSPANIDPAGTNSFTIAIMGDSQIEDAVDGTKLDEALSLAQANSDAFVIVAGDITNSGERIQYQRFQDIFTARSLTYRVTLGNHDLFYDGWSEWKNFFGRSMYSFDADNVHIVAIDSGNGVIGQSQLKWLENDLKATTKEHIIVFSHYAPWLGKFSSYFKLDSEEESAILKDMLYRYNVDYFFAGHYHGYSKIRLGRTNFVTSGAVNNLLDSGESHHFIRLTISGSSISEEKIHY